MGEQGDVLIPALAVAVPWLTVKIQARHGTNRADKQRSDIRRSGNVSASKREQYSEGPGE